MLSRSLRRGSLTRSLRQSTSHRPSITNTGNFESLFKKEYDTIVESVKYYLDEKNVVPEEKIRKILWVYYGINEDDIKEIQADIKNLYTNEKKGGGSLSSRRIHTITNCIKHVLEKLGVSDVSESPLIDYYVIVITLIILMAIHYKVNHDHKIRMKDIDDRFKSRRSQTSSRSSGGRKNRTRKHK
jgi:hypothetical protein